jgi:catechol 2,3-dioxygenase-like lactoylglutathione lyase family enzyme
MIFVNDLPRMAEFYTDTLGLKPIDTTRLENYVELESGGATLALHAIPADMRCDPQLPVAARERTPIKLSFEVPDLESERRRLETLGVTVLRRPWGAYDAVDPEGNVFGLYCP